MCAKNFTQQKGYIGTKIKIAWRARRAGWTETHRAQKKKKIRNGVSQRQEE